MIIKQHCTMDGIKERRLASYVDAMKEASEIIRKRNPDYLVAPMAGSIPFIDAMAVVDDDFDTSRVVYMPASSRIEDVSNVIVDWYHNFLNSTVTDFHEFPEILGIDEVVSGSSVARCLKNIDKAVARKRKEVLQGLIEKVHSSDNAEVAEATREADILTENQYSRDFSLMRDRVHRGVYRARPDLSRQDAQFLIDGAKASLNKKMAYRTIGIEDSKKPIRSATYQELKDAGRVIPVGVEKIISMDDPNFSTADFEVIKEENNEYVRYSPKVIGFSINPKYLEFLSALARYVGKDPDRVSPVNMSAILESSKYLSKKTE